MDIYLSKEKIFGSTKTPEQVLAYIAFRMYANTKLEKQSYHIDDLCYAIMGETDLSNSTIKKHMTDGVVKLCECYGAKYEKLYGGRFIIENDFLKFDIQKMRYLKADLEDVRLILREAGQSALLILKYYLTLLATISNKLEVISTDGKAKNDVIGVSRLEYLSKKTGLSTATITRFNEWLVNHKLIYINREVASYTDLNGQMRYCPNTYSRYEDRACADAYVNYFYKNRPHTLTKDVNKNSDVGRRMSLGRKYAKIVKNGNACGITTEELLEIKDFVLDYNAGLERQIKERMIKGDGSSRCLAVVLSKSIRDTDILDKLIAEREAGATENVTE